jgi:hypothetical protein
MTNLRRHTLLSELAFLLKGVELFESGKYDLGPEGRCEAPRRARAIISELMGGRRAGGPLPGISEHFTQRKARAAAKKSGK